MTIRLLFAVGNDKAGAVLMMDEGRATRLLRTGYAERVSEETPPLLKKETRDGSSRRKRHAQ